MKNVAIFANAAFISHIPALLSDYRTIDYITLFTGPAPLMTCRGICAWIKGWHSASNIPVVTLSGGHYYVQPEYDAVIINLFSNRYLIINVHTQEEIIGNDLCVKHFIMNHENFIFGCSFGIKDNLFDNYDNTYIYFLHANYEKVCIDGCIKYLKREIMATKEIIPLII